MPRPDQHPSAVPSGRPRMVLCRGALDVEARLLADLERLLAESPGPAPPVRLVVPSLSLRAHLLARIAQRLGRGLLGVSCQTLYATAGEIVQRSGRPVIDAPAAFALAVRRRARREEALASALAPLRDGFAAVEGSVRDLLDAGLDPALVEGIDEALTSEGPPVARRDEVARARALVRVAAGVVGDLAGSGVGRSSDLLARAAERVRHDPADALPARAVLVHGFADATGVAADLIQALLEGFRGTLYLDRPPDPAEPSRDDPGVLFTRRFRERMELFCGVEPAGDEPPAGPEVALFSALGTRAEVREVARRVRVLIDDGAAPEGIAIVARDLLPYRPLLREQLELLGVPYSVFGCPGPAAAAGRRLDALLHLLARRRDAPVERWLDALDRVPGELPLPDLRLALSSLGARRLRDLPGLMEHPALARATLPLPARSGFVELTDDRDRGPLLARRRLPTEAVARALASGAALVAALESRGGPRRLSDHLSFLRGVMVDRLGWEPDDPVAGNALDELERAFGSAALAPELTLDELVPLASRRLEEAGRSPFGGRGAGVQVMGVVEARGRTAEHLFVLGLVRGGFPRPVREDPLLPESLRGVLARQGHGVLPDLAAKRAGHAEERYLFAQLLAASPRVTLSWLEVDEDDRPQTPSPLVERLRWGAHPPAGSGRPTRVQPVTSAAAAAGWESAPSPPVSAAEGAVLTALAGDRTRLPRLLAAALAESEGGGLFAVEPAQVARARVAVLDELDPRRGTREGEATHRRLGPFFGFVGPARDDGPRAPGVPLPVTLLERLAACPWQAFLERVLRLEPTPDPLGELPRVDPRLVGNLVHRCLDALAGHALGGEPAATVEEAAERAPVAVPWPDDDELDELLGQAAAEVAAEEASGFAGLPRMLAAAARPILEEARALDWRDGIPPPPVLAVEVSGGLELRDRRGRTRRIRFRADRMDAGPVLTDYKTGRPRIGGKDAASRRAALLEAVARGRALQPAAYAVALGDDAVGRLAMLRPDPELGLADRDLALAARDEAVGAALRGATAALLELWDRGLLFPRLVEPDADREPARCSFCAVHEACVRGDSGARARLDGWAAARASDIAAGRLTRPRDRAFLAAWRLPVATPDEGSDGEDGSAG